MGKRVTVTQAYVNSLKSRVEYLEKELKDAQEDRTKFRDFTVRLLKDNVLMSTKNQYFSASTMIEKVSYLLNQVKPWYWG